MSKLHRGSALDDLSAYPSEALLEPLSIPELAPTILSSSWRRRLIHSRLRLADARMAIARLRTPARLWRVHRERRLRIARYHGQLTRRKIAAVAGRYYRDYAIPGWPSPAYCAHLANTLDRLDPARQGEPILDLAIVAITKKCSLACEHCFEWEALNQAEQLSLADIVELVARFQARRVTKIMFSGGEPLLRYRDLLEVLRRAQPGTDFWILTSGAGLNHERAKALRAAGLTGVSISLDDHDRERHNRFRGSAHAYEHAMLAAVAAHAAGLVVNLSLCATNDFATADNLQQYANLARRLGVAFIQLLEPRSVGHYAGKDVALGDEQLATLAEFYRRMNFSPQFDRWPISSFGGLLHRQVGCSGAGERFVYVDTNGDLHACPFCRDKCGSALGDSLDDSIQQLRSRGCHRADFAADEQP